MADDHAELVGQQTIFGNGYRQIESIEVHALQGADQNPLSNVDHTGNHNIHSVVFCLSNMAQI